MHKTVLVSALVACLSLSAGALERTLRLSIGPAWPHILLDTEKKTAWNAGIAAGVTVDRKIGVGGACSFLWQINREEEQIESYATRILDEQKTFMWPLTGYLFINPLPDLIVHPVIEGRIGFNMLYYTESRSDTQPAGSDGQFDPNGLYIGLIGAIGADAHFQIGDNSSLFAGLSYTWTDPTKPSKVELSNGSAVEVHRNMRGIGIRMGVSMTY
jgi:hypothetical protein